MQAIDYVNDSVRAGFVKLEAGYAELAARPGVPVISISAPVELPEGNSGTTSFPYELALDRKNTTGAVSFRYYVEGIGSTPASPSDFPGGVFPSGTGVFAANQSKQNLPILVQGDVDVETAENFKLVVVPTLELASAVSYGKILNDDSGSTLTVTNPSIAANQMNTTYTATSGSRSDGAAVVGKWYRDGVAMSPAVTGLTYTRVPSTDDGCYIQYGETPDGSSVALSNALLSGAVIAGYVTSFAGADNTPLGGFENWTRAIGGTDSGMKLVGNDLVVAEKQFNNFFSREAGSNDLEFGFVPCTLSQNGGRVAKRMYARWTDEKNCVYLNFDYNNFSVYKVIAGVTTELKGYTGFTFTDGVEVRMRVQGDYLRLFFNGVEISQSAAMNNGLGFDISGVPASTKVAISTAGSTQDAWYPQVFAYSASITPIASSGFTSSSTWQNVDNTPGRILLTVSGLMQGTAAKPQVMIMSATGQVLFPWADATVNGKAYSLTTAELPAIADGTRITCWTRDGTSKQTTATSVFDVPVQWRPITMEFGLNTNSTAFFQATCTFVNLVKHMDAGLSGSFPSGAQLFHAKVHPASCQLSGPLLAPNAASAAEVGLDDEGWPSKVPVSSGWPENTRYALLLNDGGRGFTDDAAGIYDVTFTPGLDWYIDGGTGHIARSNYNLAAGTATLTLTAGITKQVAARFIFTGFNGVANTFPPAGQRLFKAMKRGENPASAFTAKTLSSWKALTSAAKTDATKHKGYLRFMTNNDVNRNARAGLKYLYTRKAVHPNRFGYVSTTGPIGIEDMLDACVRTRTNLYANVPDTADPSMSLFWATYLNANMPSTMNVATEYSNEIMFNYSPNFSQSYDATDRAVAAGIGRRAQLGRDIKSVVALPFASIFGMDNPRWLLIVGEQAAAYSGGGANAGDNGLAEVLDEGDLYKYVKGVAVACYVGNGYSYGDGGSANGFMSKASRNKAGIDDAGFIDDYFAAQKLMSDWTRQNYWNSFANALARYVAKKGLPKGRIRPVAYEYSWHHSDMKANNKVNLTGSISQNTVTVTMNNNGPLRAGDIILGGTLVTVKDANGADVKTQITGQLTGTTGGAGTYSVNNAQTSVNSRWKLPNGAVFVGSITGTTFTVTEVNSGTITTGQVDRAPIGTIQAQLTGAHGMEGTYSIDTTFTMGSTTINSTNDVYARAAGVAMAKTLRDPRSGPAVNYVDNWLRATGGIACHFDHAGGVPESLYDFNGGASWGYQDSLGRETIDEPYISVARDMAANG
ncbi:hypothetical protein QCD71_12450 [Sphingomonas sp. PsM26]|nr:hypothetical protein [Sphingomonas sp. PsM26]